MTPSTSLSSLVDRGFLEVKDIPFSVVNETSCDYGIIGVCSFVDNSPSLEGNILSNLIVISDTEAEI